ncbi:CDP-glycerol:poly(glycerophosphate)glycerophosphotransferase [Listeria weihenstephanensis FSL R9-0317]|uniref:CDP-glycerol--poly(Glycerophosphate) glycerophosphotransferase n=1 Tax=Listeria weihenstephanensis TaxID=1006155 RepID=A0A841Z997_9LIST|nr:CDP-glycerol glycerophosphotransferase family protein [Listeria weihenstephanensis]EUJ35024.1 CDP-glycerol:poly(glycerophosphate)glycerophosphotransferase [Listeria weihenstephanensis FSL R9-0317]MBC1501439.1 CDP-glycerol--poly(glycerophosphate) glycerophosphotransferase [Listeria weihenstephanensis]
MFRKLKQTLCLLKQRWHYGNFAYHYWFLPIQKNKIVVSTHYGRGYGDSPKYIVAELLNQNFDIVWLVAENQESTLPDGVRSVRFGSKQALQELATAKIWLDNCRQKYSPPKRGQQVYIQTWHSPLRLKKIEQDAENQLPVAYLDRAKRDAKKCNYMLAGSDFSRTMYQNSFWFDGEVLPTGTPRCDLLINEDTAVHGRVAQYFETKPTMKFALYAPTFRKDASLSVYLQKFSDVKQALETRFSGEWAILVRLHPNIAKLAGDMSYSEGVINATDYPDMQELLAAADLLITDYSSSMFDMAMAGKKTILYTPDAAEYIANERAMYFDLQDLPFPIATSPETLLTQIHQFDATTYQYKLALFNQQIGSYEKGNAALTVANQIKAFCH